MADQYQQYSTVRKYWHLMRPHTLTASIVPVLVGTATAKLFLLGSQDHIKFSLFLAMLIACLLIQARLICLMNIMILKRIRRSYICRYRWRDCSKWYESKTCHESSNCFYIIAALLGIYLALIVHFGLFQLVLYVWQLVIYILVDLFLFHGRHLVNYSPDYLWV